MIKKIVRDQMFLAQKASLAIRKDISVANDMIDTIKANENCLGMAANMIGVNKRIIVISLMGMPLVMFNPVMIAKDSPYEAMEGCLSLEGLRKAIRYQNITVEYYDQKWQKKKIKLSGLASQACQHEMDHLEGIII